MIRTFLLFICVLHSIVYSTTQPTESPKEYSVLSLSSAIIDHFFVITDEQLRTSNSKKGSWSPIDYPTLCSILDRNPDASTSIPGGSGANVMKGLTQLGHKCAIMGKVGSDDKGEYYINSMRNLGVKAFLEKGNLPTGQAICFVTPDGQRTFRTYLGASHSLTDLSFDKEMLEKTTLFHIEGYQLVDQDLVNRVLKLTKEAKIKVILDLANLEVVKRHKRFILDVMEKYVDILFCNEEESKELTGLNASEACSELSKLCEVVIVTMSERGSWSQKGDEKCYTQALKVNTIDTTGAGDLYASGFLDGYLQDFPLKKCSWQGALVASYVVRRVGAEIPDAIWVEIRQRLLEEGKAFD